MYRNFVEKDDYAAYNRGVPLRSSHICLLVGRKGVADVGGIARPVVR